MQVAIHIGAHETSGDLLRETLLANAEMLKSYKTSYVDPPAYLDDLSATTGRFEKGPPHRVQNRIAAKASAFPDPNRIVLSVPNALSRPELAFQSGLLYEHAGVHAAQLRAMFSQHDVTFFMAIRNPATFIPAVFESCEKRPGNVGQFLNGTNLDLLRWSDVVYSIREETPDCPLTVWCHEDSPLVWPQLLHAITGLEDQIPIRGEFDIIKQIMTPDGMQKMLQSLQEDRPGSMDALMRVIAGFLQEHSIEDEVVETLDLSGWTPEIVANLTRDYESDIAEIGEMDGVTVVSALAKST